MSCYDLRGMGEALEGYLELVSSGPVNTSYLTRALLPASNPHFLGFLRRIA